MQWLFYVWQCLRLFAVPIQAHLRWRIKRQWSIRPKGHSKDTIILLGAPSELFFSLVNRRLCARQS